MWPLSRGVHLSPKVRQSEGSSVQRSVSPNSKISVNRLSRQSENGKRIVSPKISIVSPKMKYIFSIRRFVSPKMKKVSSVRKYKTSRQSESEN